MSVNPAGPISVEELQRIAELPYGKAAEELRKHDPAWGLGSADTPVRKWSVTLRGTMAVYANVEIEATTEDEAAKIAMRSRASRLDWEELYGSTPDDFEVDEVEPA